MAEVCSRRLGMLARSGRHYKCRNGVYPSSQVRRFPVGDERVNWRAAYADYKPPHYESPVLKNKPWADPELGAVGFHPKWHSLDDGVDRRSHETDYALVAGVPQNPAGRTGLTGRGVLGKWGPNHAADPVVTRWKRANGERVLHAGSALPILQFCAVQRHDNGEWAIPGGMVDPHEQVQQTLVREFLEEAMNSGEQSPGRRADARQSVSEFFQTGEVFYKGYVDDPRNTDNAWMETVAVNFHDDTGEVVGKFGLTAGDDAKAVQWMDIDASIALYASHTLFLEHVAKLRGANVSSG